MYNLVDYNNFGRYLVMIRGYRNDPKFSDK